MIHPRDHASDNPRVQCSVCAKWTRQRSVKQHPPGPPYYGTHENFFGGCSHSTPHGGDHLAGDGMDVCALCCDTECRRIAASRARRLRLRCLTVWQPWATLIVAGAKPWEFRGQPYGRYVNAPQPGERIGIHAGARKMRRDELQALLLPGGMTSLREAIARPIVERAMAGGPLALPLGAIVGTAVVGTAVSAGTLFGNDSDRDEHFNFAWPMNDVEAWEPVVPAKGAQGFWWWEGERL